MILDPSREFTKGIPSFNEKSAICHECSSKGWRHCDQCWNPFNMEDANFEEYHVIFPKKSLYFTYRPYRFCSNNCYNLEYLKHEKAHFNSIKADVEMFGKYNNYTEEEKNVILNYASKKLDEIETLIMELTNK